MQYVFKPFTVPKNYLPLNVIGNNNGCLCFVYTFFKAVIVVKSYFCCATHMFGFPDIGGMCVF